MLKLKVKYSLEFTTFTEVNNEIKIRAVDVERFGDYSATNHSVKDEDTFLLIKKSTRLVKILFKIYLYMGYLNGLDKAQKGEKGEKGQGFALTPDRHIHFNNKRLTIISQPQLIVMTQQLKNSSRIY